MIFTRIILLLLLVFMIASCATSPTGQRQLRLFPDAEMTRMGVSAFDQTKKKTPPSTDKKLVAYVQCVAAALISQVGGGTQWEVQVFESAEVNAFALPGGKIGVNTGILKVASNQHQLPRFWGMR
jgi:predicted Zn-dependent protease